MLWNLPLTGWSGDADEGVALFVPLASRVVQAGIVGVHSYGHANSMTAMAGAYSVSYVAELHPYEQFVLETRAVRHRTVRVPLTGTEYGRQHCDVGADGSAEPVSAVHLYHAEPAPGHVPGQQAVCRAAARIALIHAGMAPASLTTRSVRVHGCASPLTGAVRSMFETTWLPGGKHPWQARHSARMDHMSMCGRKAWVGSTRCGCPRTGAATCTSALASTPARFTSFQASIARLQGPFTPTGPLDTKRFDAARTPTLRDPAILSLVVAAGMTVTVADGQAGNFRFLSVFKWEDRKVRRSVRAM